MANVRIPQMHSHERMNGGGSKAPLQSGQNVSEIGRKWGKNPPFVPFRRLTDWTPAIIFCYHAFTNQLYEAGCTIQAIRFRLLVGRTLALLPGGHKGGLDALP